MFDTTYRPSSAQRLADQMEQLNERPVPNCTMEDLSVGDVFSSQMDIEPEKEGVTSNASHGLGHAQANDIPAPSRTNLPTAGAQVLQLHEKAVSRRKKKGKRAEVEVGRGNPALSTVRGFTPMASGDEDSDMSTAGSRVMSPQLNAVPPTNMPSGISTLKLQLDALSLSERVPRSGDSVISSNASVSSDSDRTEVMTSYEVPLEHDFVSEEAAAEEQLSSSVCNTPQNDLCRKMTSRDFEQLMCLGKGTFGTVLLVRHKPTGRLYAQKQFRKASITVHRKLVEQTKTERMILESVNRHPFVVKLFYAFQDHEKLYLILEYAQGGELFTHLAAERMFSEDTAAFYMAEMVLALEHLHQTVGVVYRDLKPENCLLDSEGHLLLTDFGLSKVAVNDDDRCNSSLGTIEYMAPEVILGKPYGKACDWWSLGALGYDLLTGSPPFKANNHAKIQEKIVKQKLSLPYYLGPDAKDLLIRLLRKEPHKRLGYHMPKDLDTIKKHRFFRKIDWKALARRELEAPIQPLITDPALAENFSTDFTGLALSPALTDDVHIDYMLKNVGLSAEPSNSVGDADPFHGFSFVASSSLLNSGFSFAT
ncbi:hypothetical protein EYB25_001863 [Talaromyces marneffei]|uniref:Serine/threonine protein kinase, putative n=1 Tax=Talaromyces marneffei (strain ATCC 18224 / CBS 334.59 / QM 7333) TaxID=441960 RepID=B6Q3T8_TALMQ|nr:serine/threonine protein kinase, putative [Talaromyces marneffei ATCC 18224]KAE8557157.1 hypothetical protein EYB25_001863 [Talaromyces marneffei]